MICPTCKSEYVEGIYTCPDCDIKLVYELPQEIEPHFEVENGLDYVCIYSPSSNQETAMIKMILNREQIHYFIKNEHKHGLGASLSISNANIGLFVPEDKAEFALELLRTELGIK